MIRRISIDRWDAEIIQFLKDIQGQPDRYVLELEGQPVAEVTPQSVKGKKAEFLDLLNPIRKQAEHLSVEEVEHIVDEAVQAVRNQHADTNCA